MSNVDSAHFWLCLVGSLSNWVFFYLDSFHLGNLATSHSAHIGLCPLLVLSTLDSAHVWLLLFGLMSTWVFVYVEAVHLEVWPHDKSLTKDCVHSWLSLIWILLTFGSVYLAVCPPGTLSTLILSTGNSVYMRIL